MRLAAALLAAALTGCATPGVVPIRWVKTDDPNATCTKLIGPHASGRPYRACAWIDKDGGCTMYSPDFTSTTAWDLMARLGHETKHCFDKHWHP